MAQLRRFARACETLLAIGLALALQVSPAGSQTAGSPMPAAAPGALRARLGPALAARLTRPLPPEGLSVLVALRANGVPRAGRRRPSVVAERQQRVLAALPAGSFSVKRRYRNLNGFAVRASKRALDALLRHEDAAVVYLDGRVHASVVQGIALTGADLAQASGYTGDGVKVAVLDTGIDTDHPDLQTDIAAQHCFCSGAPGPGCCAAKKREATTAEDDEGHGTSVAGIITSAGAVAGVGVAPDAKIVAVKVLDASGDGNFSDIAAALDWVLTESAVPGGVVEGVRVVNMSLGDGVEYSDPAVAPCTGSNTADAISLLEQAGITVVVSSGNEGFDDGIAFPACATDAISVGGVYDAALGNVNWCGSGPSCAPYLCSDTATAADDFVCHSNSDEILDVLAPNWRTNTSARGGGTANFAGTSASAPFVAGAAALMVEADPSLTPAQVKAQIVGGGPLVTNPDNGLAFRRVDIGAAVAAVAPIPCGDGIIAGGEACDDGAANGTTVCGCASDCSFPTVGTSCSDGVGCTLPDACDGAGSCAPGAPDDAACDNGLYCDGAESCDALSDCLPGTPPPVDDGVACTDDSCDEINDGIVNAANDSHCDNGLYCDGAESCDALSDCQPGTPPPVDDGVACTVDSCDETLDQVVNLPDDLACDDADPCTAETCDGVSGCRSEPIIACGNPIPASSGGGRRLLALLLLAAGAAVRRRHIR